MQKLIHYLSVVIVLLIFMGIYAQFLSRTMTFDETITYLNYAGSPLQALFNYTQPNNHLLNSLFIWFSTSLMGVAPMTIRYPAFVAGILAVAAMYRLGSRVISHHGGLLAMAVLGSIYSFADYVVNGRGYSLTIFLTITLLEQVYFVTQPLQRKQNYTILLLAYMQIMTIPTMILFNGTLILWQSWKAYTARYRSDYVGVIIPLVTGTIIGLMFYIYTLVSGSYQRHVSNFGYSQPLALAVDTLKLIAIPPIFGYILFVVFLDGVIIALYKKQDTLRAFALWVIGSAILLTCIQWLLIGKLFFPRTYLYLLPIVALLTAFALAQLPSYLPAIAVVLLLVLAAFMLQLLGAASDVDQWLQALEVNRQDGDLIVAGCCLYEPIYFHKAIMEEQYNLFQFMDNTRRFILIPTDVQPIDTLVNFFGLQDSITNCREQTWSAGDVYLCDVAR